MNEVSIYILAGGQSTRMQHDKGSLSWNESNLLTSMVLRCQSISSQVFVLSGHEEHQNPAWTTIPDEYPLCGPVGAIDAALHHATTPYIVLCAVDMPWLSAEGIHALAHHTSEARVVGFSLHEKAQLFPIRLHTSLAAAWRNQLLAGERKLQTMLHQFTPTFVPGDFLLATSPRFFFNINTPEAYHEALLWQQTNLK